MGSAFIWQLIVIAMIGYLIGSINMSIILSKLMGKGDIREHGSGNAGTTNTLRTLGIIPAILVLLFDIFKGVLAVLICQVITTISLDMTVVDLELGLEYATLVSGFAVILGHNFPIYYGFRGGKGIATSLGVIITIEPTIGITCLLFGVLLILASRMVSLGSVFAAFLYPVLVITHGEAFSDNFEFKYMFPYFMFSCCLAALAICRHKTNIRRLLDGTENKLWLTKKEKEKLAAKTEKQELNKADNQKKKQEFKNSDNQKNKPELKNEDTQENKQEQKNEDIQENK